MVKKKAPAVPPTTEGGKPQKGVNPFAKKPGAKGAKPKKGVNPFAK